MIGSSFLILFLSAYLNIIGWDYYKDPNDFKKIVISNTTKDSIVFIQTFDKQESISLQDTNFCLYYYEFYPDSLVPESAIVVGKLTVQKDNAQDAVRDFEKYTKVFGANCIIEFQEPRMKKINNEFVYTAYGILLKVNMQNHFSNVIKMNTQISKILSK